MFQRETKRCFKSMEVIHFVGEYFYFLDKGKVDNNKL